jgi:hypothetical protein
MEGRDHPPGPGRLARWVPIASWLPRYQRAEQLDKLADDLNGRNVALGLAHVHGPALEMAERSGLLAKIGADRVFPTTLAAVAWARSLADAPTPGSGAAGSTGIIREG